jgi:hypothetical protein
MDAVTGWNVAEPWIQTDAERALRDGRMLASWFFQTDAANSYRDVFPLLENVAAPDRAIGFFDHAPISTGTIPILGYAHEMSFDIAKDGAAEDQCGQLREFVLRYLLRVSEITPPQPGAELGFGPLTDAFLKLMKIGPTRQVVHRGFGHVQLCYKDAAGQQGLFPEAEQAAIVDLREIGPKYQWVVMRARPFDYEMDLAPVGPAGPRLVLPLPDSPTIVLSPDWIVNQDRPAPGVLGRYGFGYALLHDPTPIGPQVYGPAQFEACFQVIHFEMLETGESRVRMAFAGNQPDRILDVKIDPIGLGLRAGGALSFGLTDRLLKPFQPLLDRRPTFGSFDPLLGFLSLANTATAGLASKGFDISRRQLFKDILTRHFQLYYQLILDSLLAYRKVRDWRDTASLPPWAMQGTATTD